MLFSWLCLFLFKLIQGSLVRRGNSQQIRRCECSSLPIELSRHDFKVHGGGGGIRTPARLAAPLGFQDRPLQPLGYSSKKATIIMVDLVGLEPTTGRL